MIQRWDSPAHVSKLVVMQLCQQTERAGLLRIIDSERVHGYNSKQHPVRQRED